MVFSYAVGSNPLTAVADGTAVMLTSNNFFASSVPPAPYSDRTWYYLKNTDTGFVSGQQVFELYSDANLTTPVGPVTGLANGTTANINFWVSPVQGIDSAGTLHAMPADDSGMGMQQSSSGATWNGYTAMGMAINLYKAYGITFTALDGTGIDEACANFNTIWTAINLTLNDCSLYAYDSSLT